MSVNLKNAIIGGYVSSYVPVNIPVVDIVDIYNQTGFESVSNYSYTSKSGKSSGKRVEVFSLNLPDGKRVRIKVGDKANLPEAAFSGSAEEQLQAKFDWMLDNNQIYVGEVKFTNDKGEAVEQTTLTFGRIGSPDLQPTVTVKFDAKKHLNATAGAEV